MSKVALQFAGSSTVSLSGLAWGLEIPQESFLSSHRNIGSPFISIRKIYYAFESRFVIARFRPVVLILSAGGFSKIAFSIIQRIAIPMIDALSGSSKDESMQAGILSDGISGLTRPSNFCPPLKSLSALRIFPVNESPKFPSQRDVCDGWANRYYGLYRALTNILRGHGFSPVRFVQPVLRKQDVTMQIIPCFGGGL